MPTLTATPEPGNSPPRVLLQLNMADVSPVPTSATISRLDPDGRTRLVRLADPAALSGGAFTGYDYESPFGSPVTYTATAGSTVVTSTAVTLAVDDVWLRHPGIPSLSRRVTYQGRGSLGSRSRASTRAVFTPLGRRTPVVVTGVSRLSVETELLVLTRTAVERNALWDLFDDDSVLLLTVPASREWGVTHEYISIGAVQEQRIVGLLAEQTRTFTLPYTVVDRPAGGLQAQFTWADVLAENATWSDVLTKYATWSDVLANRKKA